VHYEVDRRPTEVVSVVALAGIGLMQCML
jgi:hypothetical protein